eukprot:snap_masked-scaffold_4-processed-gene-19.26-mRNA-1 protein AED:1.00 eAED:1.00 QI:0/-1/0/0/-1/1/1/0/227
MENLEITKALTPNLWKITNKNLHCIIYVWKKPVGCKLKKMDVFKFVESSTLKPDVVILDPPYRIFSDNPIRGPRISYSTLSDEQIENIPLWKLGDDVLYFIWTIPSKRSVSMKLMEKNGIRFVGRLIWVKMTPAGKVASTLGNLTGACTNECLLGLKRNLPHRMLRRFLGKEVIFGIKTGNSQKPVELYELIEANFSSEALKAELFGRNNNAREGWLTVGNEIGFSS